MFEAIALAITASAGFGLADFLGGIAARVGALAGVTLASLLSATAVVASIFLLAGQSFSANEVGWAAGAGLMLAASTPLLYAALASAPMSLVAPITSSGAVLPAAVGLARGASVGPITGLGLGLAFFGIIVVARATPHGATLHGVSRRGLVLSLGASIAMGGEVTLLQAAASSRGGSALGTSLVVLAVATGTVMSASAFLFHLDFTPKSATGMAIFSGAASGIGLTVFSQASRSLGATTVVAVLSSLYPVWTILLARIVLGERLSRVQAGGVLCALLGVAIVSTI